MPVRACAPHAQAYAPHLNTVKPDAGRGVAKTPPDAK